MAAIKTRYRLLMRIHSPKNDRLSRRGARRWPFAAAKARARDSPGKLRILQSQGGRYLGVISATLAEDSRRSRCATSLA